MADLMENLRKLGLGAGSIIMGVAAMGVALVIIFVLWTQDAEYQVLYSNLSSEDSGSVIERLKEKRIPYKVENTAISVPSERVYETRMELAGEGLPQGGGIGFEIFDKTGFGITDFVQKVNYKRALQGELARTIGQLKEVESARVHLAIPEKGVFLDEQKRARASIVIKLKPGKTLAEGQVLAITHLVANSFENLKPEDVAVVDTGGRMWTRSSGDNGAASLTASQLDYKRALEKDMEARVQSMLEKTVGANKVVARVSLDIEARQIERTEETFDPESQVIRSEQRNKENSVGNAVAVGVPGVLSNTPDSGTATVAASQPQTQRQDELINYEINKVTSHVVEPQTLIKRLTVAVLVDGTYTAQKDAEGKELKQYAARNDEDIAKFTDMVKGAVGFDEQRGDVITVASTPFEDAYVDPALLEPEKVSIVNSIVSISILPTVIKYGSIVFVAFLTFIFVLKPAMNKFTTEKETLEMIQRTLPQGFPQPELALGPGIEKETVERLKKLVKTNPQQAAMVLRGWIKEK